MDINSTQFLNSNYQTQPSKIDLDILITYGCLFFLIIFTLIIILIKFRRKKIIDFTLLEKQKSNKLDELISEKISSIIPKDSNKTNDMLNDITEFALEENEGEIHKKKKNKNKEDDGIVFDNVVIKKKKKKRKKKKRNEKGEVIKIDEKFINNFKNEDDDIKNQNSGNRLRDIKEEEIKYQQSHSTGKNGFKIKQKKKRKISIDSNRRKSKESNNSDKSVKKVVNILIQRNLVQFTNENRSEPSSNEEDIDFSDEEEYYNKEETIQRQMNRQVSMITSVIDKKSNISSDDEIDDDIVEDTKIKKISYVRRLNIQTKFI